MHNSGITSWPCPMQLGLIICIASWPCPIQLGAFMRNSGITSWPCPMQLGAFMRNSGITSEPSLVHLDFSLCVSSWPCPMKLGCRNVISWEHLCVVGNIFSIKLLLLIQHINNTN